MPAVWQTRRYRPSSPLLLFCMSTGGIPSQKETSYQTPTVYIMSNQTDENAGAPQSHRESEDRTPLFGPAAVRPRPRNGESGWSGERRSVGTGLAFRGHLSDLRGSNLQRSVTLCTSARRRNAVVV